MGIEMTKATEEMAEELARIRKISVAEAIESAVAHELVVSRARGTLTERPRVEDILEAARRFRDALPKGAEISDPADCLYDAGTGLPV